MTRVDKRHLALDVGQRRTGLAATDPTGTICVPLGTLEHRGIGALPELLEPILHERETEVLVVGVPFRAGGSPGPQARKVLELVTRLRRRYPDLEVCTVDESLTSDAAHRLLAGAGLKAARRKRHVDEVAALAILQRFLGWPEAPPPEP